MLSMRGKCCLSQLWGQINTAHTEFITFDLVVRIKNLETPMFINQQTEAIFQSRGEEKRNATEWTFLFHKFVLMSSPLKLVKQQGLLWALWCMILDRSTTRKTKGDQTFSHSLSLFLLKTNSTVVVVLLSWFLSSISLSSFLFSLQTACTMHF